jgi:outer membrane lipoprotein SlyB
METVAGIFNSPLEARQAALDLRPVGFENSDISLLLPGSSEAALASLPTEEAEQPGMGRALGSVVGGAVGLAGSAPLGAALASVILPGIGPVIAIGFAAAALGALVGGATGATMEKSMTGGLPKDELFFYEDALKKGKSVVVAIANDEARLASGKAVLMSHGAESIDAARDAWWIGLRDAEATQYSESEGDFADAEALYRKGFEAALDYSVRGKHYDEAVPYLRDLYPDIYAQHNFISGYERGRIYQH